MYFILRASDDYSLVILAEGEAAQAPSPSENPPCWLYEAGAKTDEISERLADAGEADRVFHRVSAEEARHRVSVMRAVAPDLGDWPRNGFWTLQEVWEWVRARQREYRNTHRPA